MAVTYQNLPQMLICHQGQDALIPDALEQLSHGENGSASACTFSTEKSGSFKVAALTVQWICCSVLDRRLQEGGTTGMPLPVIGCCRCPGITGVVSPILPEQNDMLRLCVEDGFRRSGVPYREEPISADAMAKMAPVFSPLKGTAVYLWVGDVNSADFEHALKLICGFLERRLDAVRGEIAQAQEEICG